MSNGNTQVRALNFAGADLEASTTTPSPHHHHPLPLRITINISVFYNTHVYCKHYQEYYHDDFPLALLFPLIA